MSDMRTVTIIIIIPEPNAGFYTSCNYSALFEIILITRYRGPGVYRANSGRLPGLRQQYAKVCHAWGQRKKRNETCFAHVSRNTQASSYYRHREHLSALLSPIVERRVGCVSKGILPPNRPILLTKLNFARGCTDPSGFTYRYTAGANN